MLLGIRRCLLAPRVVVRVYMLLGRAALFVFFGCVLFLVWRCLFFLVGCGASVRWLAFGLCDARCCLLLCVVVVGVVCGCWFVLAVVLCCLLCVVVCLFGGIV